MNYSKYNILTVCNNTYYVFVKILIRSILDKCNTDNINSIMVVDTGLSPENKEYLTSISELIHVIDTDIYTEFNGGIWGIDWRTNVQNKTIYLLDAVTKLQEPVLMLDSDMMILNDLYGLLQKGGDIQVCIRSNDTIPYIGSYFFSINHEKSIDFIKEWIIKIQNTKHKGQFESPELVNVIQHYKSDIDIVKLKETCVNVLDPNFISNESYIAHFKGSSIQHNVDDLIKTRITNRGWTKFIETYV